MTIPNYTDVPLLESCLPLTPEEERDAIKKLNCLVDQNSKEGDVFCLIDASWMRGWQEYVGYNCDNYVDGCLPALLRPGKIDNSRLVSYESDEEALRRNLQEGEDYILVPHKVWKKLHEWYQGGPELPRKLISEGVNGKQFTVEVYPLSLKIVDARNQSKKNITISRNALVRDLHSIACKLFNLKEAQVEIWDNFDVMKPNAMKCFSETLQEAQLQMDQEILLKVKDNSLLPSNFGKDSTGNELALVIVEPSRSPVTIAGGPTLANHSTGLGSNYLDSFSSSLGDTEDDIVSMGSDFKIDRRGLTGLHNLGNTCFMNSALQCLVHTPNLVQFFLENYSQEINMHNPLGMKGELAIAFGDLLRQLWSTGQTSIAPRAFKSKLARFAPQFVGYNQHDSQELLAFLLDGLHEDLNRVKKKPYIEAKEPNGRSDEEYADECWENHKARNDSIIVDVCQGQYKSTVCCPVCSKVSVMFDPFMYLSLPLPSTTRSITVSMFSSDGSFLSALFTVDVPRTGTCRHLIRSLSTACGLQKDEDILLAEVSGGLISRFLDIYESLSGIKDDDHLVAYKLPRNYKEYSMLRIIHMVKADSQWKPQYNTQQQKHIGTPLVTVISKEARTGANIYTAVSTLISSLSRGKTDPSQSDTTACDGHLSSSPSSTLPTYDMDQISSDSELSTSHMEIEGEDADNLEPFRLFLTNESGDDKALINKESVILSRSPVRVILEWSDETNELYDFSQLEDIPEVSKSTNFLAKKQKQEAITLLSCLDAFLKEEPLGPDDMWYCPNCKEHRQASKKLDLWRLPEILVVHLKRFSYSRYMKSKLDTYVNFPIHNLDLSKYVNHNGAEQSYVYELYAVSNHYGGLGGGHYTAYAKLALEDSWYHFDDSLVSAVSEGSVRTQAAYVLFYRRVKAGTETTHSSSSNGSAFDM